MAHMQPGVFAEPDFDGVMALPLFAGLSDSEMLAVQRCCGRRFVEPGEYVTWQGEACNAFFIVCSGALKLVRIGSRSEKRIVGFVGERDIIAEEALLSGDGYQHSVIAMLPSELISVRAVPFARLMQQNARLAWNMVVGLSRRTGELLERIEHLTTMSAEQRVAAHLLAQFDPDHPERIVVSGFHRQRDLASVLAVAPETLSRITGRFKRLGWIETGDEGVTLKAPDALARLIS